MSRIGFIGLGVMGREMATNLAKAGHDVHAYDVRPEAIRACTAEGAYGVTSVAAASRDADIGDYHAAGHTGRKSAASR
ncbi:MAG: hypothetical protein PVSMB1_19270 [Gemmatimonadaceae bacterium]